MLDLDGCHRLAAAVLGQAVHDLGDPRHAVDAARFLVAREHMVWCRLAGCRPAAFQLALEQAVRAGTVPDPRRAITSRVEASEAA